MSEFPIYSHIRYDAVPNEDGNLRLALIDVSTNDWVEVVRCKDCIHNNSNDPICPIPWVNRMINSFCSFGERRTDK
jgi:hypothetical protein